jgi:hypothetical protein
LGDVSSDDTFAHLSIFIQRLAREDEREIMAWSPIQEDKIFQIGAKIERKDDQPMQKLVLNPVTEGEAE